MEGRKYKLQYKCLRTSHGKYPGVVDEDVQRPCLLLPGLCKVTHRLQGCNVQQLHLQDSINFSTSRQTHRHCNAGSLRVHNCFGCPDAIDYL